MKRKNECMDFAKQEAKRRKKLEGAKKFLESSDGTIKAAAIKFGVDRGSLSAYMKSGFQNIGRKSLLNGEGISYLGSYLSALDTAHLQQTTLSASSVIQKLSETARKPSAPMVRKYVQETGMYI